MRHQEDKAVGEPRGVLSRWPGQGEPVEHRRLFPCDALRPFVEHFWWVQWRLEEPFVAETLSHPTMHLSWDTASGRAEVTGIHKKRFVRRLEGQGHVFGIKLRPAMLYALAPQAPPAHRLTQQSVLLEHLWGEGIKPFEESIREAKSLGEAACAAERFWGPRLRGLEVAPELEVVRGLVEAIAAEPELLRVEEVARRLGKGRRSLERLFRRYLGVGPRWVIRRYRLMEAAARIQRGELSSMAELAAELAYFDQPHFARDFREVVGCSPLQFAQRHRGATRL